MDEYEKHLMTKNNLNSYIPPLALQNCLNDMRPVNERSRTLS